MIFGPSCATVKKIRPSTYVIEPSPDVMPDLVDNTPVKCARCVEVNNQPMLKLTERDFLAIKIKLIEQAEYIDYLLNILND